jgi:hypothetical protein
VSQLSWLLFWFNFRISKVIPRKRARSRKLGTAAWAFSYTAWIYFWNRQIERSGKVAFLKFERACFSDPQSCQSAFAAVYGTDLRRAVDDLQAEVRSGRVSAPEPAMF